MSTNGYMAVGHSSQTDEWPTPQWIVDQAAKEFGPFDLDPAAGLGNAKAPRFYSVDDDGLMQPWLGRVWLNPPYGRTIGRWMAKARAEVAAARAELVVCLVPVRVDAHWWRRNIIHAEPTPLVRFWPGRLQFEPGVDAPFASATVVYGHKATGRRHGRVAKECTQCGGIFWPANSKATTCSRSCKESRLRADGTSRLSTKIDSLKLPRIDSLNAFARLVLDDPGRAQMIARQYLRAVP